MAVYQILCWKEIPAQLRAYEGKKAIARALPEDFQVEIDRIAMQEGLTGTDEYLDQWRWSEKRERPGSAQEVLEELARELEGKFTQLFNKQR